VLISHFTEAALASYVVNSEREKIGQEMAFVLCYVGAHFALDLITRNQAARIMDYCEKRWAK